jgi:uncharacterized membrane protein
MVALVKNGCFLRGRGAAGASGALLVLALTACGRSPFDDVAVPPRSGATGDAGGPTVAGPRFQPLPLRPDCADGLVPTDLSDDGLVVVGNCSDTLALRWSAATGYEELPISGQVFGTNADGSVLVGSTNGTAYRLDWPSREVTMLGGAEATAFAVSADGSVVVGRSASVPCVWNRHGNPWLLDADIGVNDPTGWAAAVSADGWVVVGQSGNRAFRYTETSGLVDVGPTWRPTDASARGVSHDGVTVVGASLSADNPAVEVPFKWTRESRHGLPGPVGCSGAIAVDVSADGSVVAIQGRSCNRTSNGHGAAVWQMDDSTRTIEEIVVRRGGDLAGWSLAGIVALSADGRVVLGAGQDSAGNDGAWLARID